MEAETSHELNESVCVQFASDASVFGVVKWKSKKGPKYNYGCEFIRDSPAGRSAKVIRKFCNVPTKAIQEVEISYSESLTV